jgi:hypothetical protein
MISWVFELPDEFEKITQIAQREDIGELQKQVAGLPIPDVLIGVW